MDSDTFRDELIKIALPRLILSLFDKGVEYRVAKCYSQHVEYLNQMDHMLNMDENGEHHADDTEIKNQAERFIHSSTELVELLEEAKKEVTDIRQEYIKVMDQMYAAAHA